MAIQNPINVTIASYDAENRGQTAYIGIADDGQSLVLKTALDLTTTWTLIPNLAAGALCAGVTLYNNAGTAGNQCACIPAVGNQITLNDDPTPYGTLIYCWTIWSYNTWQGLQLWVIQDNQRGPCMDAAYSGLSAGTQILLWPWNGGDNQQWILRAV